MASHVPNGWASDPVACGLYLELDAPTVRTPHDLGPRSNAHRMMKISTASAMGMVGRDGGNAELMMLRRSAPRKHARSPLERFSAVTVLTA